MMGVLVKTASGACRKEEGQLGMVWVTCNPTYSRGRDGEDSYSRPFLAKSETSSQPIKI
jgi:hypothetical protein